MTRQEEFEIFKKKMIGKKIKDIETNRRGDDIIILEDGTRIEYNCDHSHWTGWYSFIDAVIEPKPSEETK